MKTNFIITFMVGVFLSFNMQLSAQLSTPRNSQQAKVSQTVGITEITVSYSRPKVSEREIWGNLVPYGMNNLGFGTATEAPWRAGADENTTISFAHDVMVEGKEIKAGTYGLHVIVKENDGATIIFSNNSTSWGSFFYDEKEDALRVDVKTKEAPFHELLTYEFNAVEPTSTIVSLIWEKKEIPFKIDVPVSDVVLTDMRNKLRNSTGFDKANWERAARYALNNNGDLEEALSWVDNAIGGQFIGEKTATNLGTKAAILAKMGRTNEAFALYEEAASIATTNQLNNLGYQMLAVKDYDRAIKFFKQNVKNNPENANCYDSLGEAYKMVGDKKNAVKNFKKSLSLNPPPAVKANSEKLLRELGEEM